MAPHDETTPVIVGVGHATLRAGDLDDTLEPAALLGRALDEAARDARIGPDGPQIDRVEVLNLLSWRYGDPVGAVAAAAGIDGVGGRYSPIGGDQPTRLLAGAARSVAAGRSSLTAVVGGEALRSRRLWQRAGRRPPWTPRADPPEPWDPTSGLGHGALEHGLTEPVTVYPLVEAAARAAAGLSFAAAQARSGLLWSRLSEVAARTPGAWVTAPLTPEEITTATPDNRWIAHPYTKRMCALPGVDQAAAVVVASVAAARRLGVPEERWVWPWADAGAHDTVEILERPSFATSEPMAAVLHDAMRAAGLEIGDVDLWELYSCFPVVPKLAIDALGLDDDAPVTVAGGLPFYGGPFNAYMLCAAVNMVRRLRAGDGVTGLLYGNGEFVTKHHALVVGRGPGPAGRLTDATTDSDDGSRQARLDRRPAPAVTTRPDGPARIETATVVYDRDGTPARGIVVGRTATGARFVANTPVAADQFAALVDPDVEPVGRSGSVQSNGDTAVFSLD